MSLAKKISQIRDLDSLKPDKRWEKTTKYDLLEEISSQNRLMQAQKLDNKEQADLFVSRVLNRFAPSMAKAVATFLIIMMGSGVGFVAQASIPGEPLWPIKRSIEKAELALTFSPIRETEIHIKHLKVRASEIGEILESENGTPEKKEKKEKALQQAVTHLAKDVAAVDSSLKVAKAEKTPVEVVELAKKVTDATKEVANDLKKKKQSVSDDKNIGKALDSAEEANKLAKDSAVAVALEVHEEILAKNNQSEPDLDLLANTEEEQDTDMEVESSTVEFLAEEEPTQKTMDEEAETVKNLVKEILASEIDETSVEVEDIKNKVGEVSDEDIQAIKQDNSGMDEASTELESIADEDPEEVKAIIEEAKALLEEGFLKNAYSKISQVKEKYQRAEVVLSEIEEAISNHNTLGSEVLEPEETVEGEEPVDMPAEEPAIKEEGGDLEASAIKTEPVLDPKN